MKPRQYSVFGLCAILTALCSPATAQYLDLTPRQQPPEFTLPDERDIYRDEQIRQLQQQRDDAQRQLEAERYRSMMNDVRNNFGCDIHNHCR